MLFLVGVIAGLVALGTIVYLAVKLTVSVLKNFKKKKTSKLMAAQVKDLIKQAPEISLDSLDDDDVVLAEYDVENDELVQDTNVARDVDQKVSSVLKNNGGIVVFD